MAVLHALRTAAGAVGRNPIVFVVAAAFSLLQVPNFVAQAIDPLLGSVVSLATTGLFVFVVPFLFAGIIGMSNEALDGRTSLETFVDAGKAHYVSMLAAYLLVVGLSVVLGIVVFVVFLVGGAALLVGGSAGGMGGAGPALLVVVGLVALAALLLYLLAAFFVQFYGHAIVVDDLGAIAGLKRSVSCVRKHLLAVFGYSLIVGAVGAVFGLFGAAFSLLTSPRVPGTMGAQGMSGAAAAPPTTPLSHLPTIGSVGVVALTVAFVVLSGVVGGFFAVYSTAFYRAIRPEAAHTPVG
jgi:hypothetical protein